MLSYEIIYWPKRAFNAATAESCFVCSFDLRKTVLPEENSMLCYILTEQVVHPVLWLIHKLSVKHKQISCKVLQLQLWPLIEEASDKKLYLLPIFPDQIQLQ